MNPNERHELTLVDYYALAIAPAIYRAGFFKMSDHDLQKNLRIFRLANETILEQATNLATMSLALRNQSPTEGIRDERSRT